MLSIGGLCVNAGQFDGWEVRLDGANGHFGLLSVKPPGNDTVWGTVCGPITAREARSVCRALFPNTINDLVATVIPAIDNGRGLIVLSNFACPEGANFSDCTGTQSFPLVKYNQCSHANDVGVGCFHASDSVPNPTFNVTYDALAFNGNGAQTLQVANMIRSILQLPTTTTFLIDTTNSKEELYNGDWAHLVFRFNNGTDNPDVPAWVAAQTFNLVCPYYLFRRGIYNVYSNLLGPMTRSDVHRNPYFWSWRLTNDMGSEGYLGRVEVLPGTVPGTEWGSVCGTNFGTTEAAAICNTLGFAASPYTVTPLLGYGGGRGPVYLSKLSCQATNDLSFMRSCSHYSLSTPTDRGANVCDHSQDVGVNCLAASMDSTHWTARGSQLIFTAFINNNEEPTGLQEKITVLAGVPTDRMQIMEVFKSNEERNITIVQFNFSAPQADDDHKASIAALDTFVMSFNGASLYTILGVQQLLYYAKPTPGSSVNPTTAPTFAVQIFAADVKSNWTNADVINAVAAFADTKSWVFTIGMRQPIPNGGTDVRVLFSVRPTGIPYETASRVQQKLDELTQLSDLIQRLGFIGFQLVPDGTVPPQDESHGARTVVFFLAMFLVVVLIAYILVQRMKYSAALEQQYQPMTDDEEAASRRPTAARGGVQLQERAWGSDGAATRSAGDSEMTEQRPPRGSPQPQTAATVDEDRQALTAPEDDEPHSA